MHAGLHVRGREQLPGRVEIQGCHAWGAISMSRECQRGRRQAKKAGQFPADELVGDGICGPAPAIVPGHGGKQNPPGAGRAVANEIAGGVEWPDGGAGGLHVG
jgi:hypothetical protein